MTATQEVNSGKGEEQKLSPMFNFGSQNTQSYI